MTWKKRVGGRDWGNIKSWWEHQNRNSGIHTCNSKDKIAKIQKLKRIYSKRHQNNITIEYTNTTCSIKQYWNSSHAMQLIHVANSKSNSQIRHQMIKRSMQIPLTKLKLKLHMQIPLRKLKLHMQIPLIEWKLKLHMQLMVVCLFVQ